MVDFSLPPTVPAAAPLLVADSLGLAFLGRRVFENEGLTQVWDGLVQRLGADMGDTGALMDLSILVQMTGEREKGLELQAAAIAACPCYRTVHGRGVGPRLLVFATAGDLMVNTPIDFLLETSEVDLTICYLEGGLPSPDRLPDHDVAFLAIGQSDDGSRALCRLPDDLTAWPRPVLNGHPQRIAALSRDGVADRFAGHAKIICPATRRVSREDLAAVADGQTALAVLHADLRFPVIVRPIGSHAGTGLEKADDSGELADYLARYPQAEFFIAAFFDYSGADGLYRKLRVVFVNGRPFVAHMAVSRRWMVHYLNADMDDPMNRADEARMMATFDTGFAARHAEAFADLTRAFGLEYYGIDCAETRDGRLVVFEADVGMIVHAMDPAETYPYKKPAMAKIFDAFVGALGTAAEQKRVAA